MVNKIDLHIHSCYSEDGEYTPSDLVQMCNDAGINLMAIADHNCVKGVGEAAEKAKNLQMRCYSAIEIDCIFNNINFHVLGYDIDYKSSDFEDIEQNIRKQCIHTSKERLKLINKLGFDVTEDELNAINANNYWSEHWTGEVFAEALLNNDKYLKSKILMPYRNGGSRSDNPYVNFYWDYCSQGKACFAKMAYPDMHDVIDIIHRNKGRAVLAHPGVNLKDNFNMVEEIIPLGIDGIEAFSSYHDVDTAYWFSRKAREHSLFVTQGSDFHGKTKPSIKLGCYAK